MDSPDASSVQLNIGGACGGWICALCSRACEGHLPKKTQRERLHLLIRAEERRQRAAHDCRVEHVAELRDLGEHEPRVPLRLYLVLVDPVVTRLPQLRVPLGGEVRDGEPGQCSTIRRRGIVSLEPKTEPSQLRKILGSAPL